MQEESNFKANTARVGCQAREDIALIVRPQPHRWIDWIKQNWRIHPTPYYLQVTNYTHTGGMSC